MDQVPAAVVGALRQDKAKQTEVSELELLVFS